MCALLVFAAVGCEDSGGGDPTATQTAAITATPAPTQVPVRALIEQIGVRGDLPEADPVDLAQRYGRAPRPLPPPVARAEASVGDTREFDVALISGAAIAGDAPPEVRRIRAKLKAKSEHAYFYADEAIGGDTAAFESAAAEFESSTWPRVTGTFGLPDVPGIDGDSRIVVLQSDLGGAVGGYQSGDDVVPRIVRPYSNEAEMVYMDRTLRPGGAAFNVVLAHEFQHLIHTKADAGEEAWMNEGLSETASGLVGGAVSSIGSFEAHPETQLNGWEPDDSAPHYGAGAAFGRYLADRFGGDAVLGELARAQGDGAAGVDQVLEAYGFDGGFKAIVADWMTANTLNLQNGPYANPSRAVNVEVSGSLAFGDVTEAEAPQFGADYYLLKPGAGEQRLTFSGADTVPVISAGGDGAYFWSNGEDFIDTTLTREVAVPQTGASLTFRTWSDIERWYDWGYVAVSEDGGASWRALEGQRTSTDDPVKVALGPGYTGKTGDADPPAWLDETVDLTPYAGKRVLLRFEYVTDGSTTGEGWAIDDVRVGGAPLDDAGWERGGWVLVDGGLPQEYTVRLIAMRAGAPVVLDMPLDAAQRGELRFDPAGLQDAVLLVSGATEGTIARAPYRVELRGP